MRTTPLSDYYKQIKRKKTKQTKNMIKKTT